MCICRLCSCINYHAVCAKSIFIISGCVVVSAKCVDVYVASVSISAGYEGVFIVRICVYAKSLYVYIPMCRCTCGYIYRLCMIKCRVCRDICKVCRCSCDALRCIAWSEGIYECQCFRNEFEYTETHKPKNTSCNMILMHSMDFVC